MRDGIWHASLEQVWVGLDAKAKGSVLGIVSCSANLASHFDVRALRLSLKIE